MVSVVDARSVILTLATWVESFEADAWVILSLSVAQGYSASEP